MALGFALSTVLVFANSPREKAKITVTGCIRRSENSRDTSTTKFLLTHAELNAPATVGTSGKVDSNLAVAPEYRLKGDYSKLLKLMDTRVEISGIANTDFAEFGPATALVSAPKLAIETVRELSSSCP